MLDTYDQSIIDKALFFCLHWITYLYFALFLMLTLLTNLSCDLSQNPFLSPTYYKQFWFVVFVKGYYTTTLWLFLLTNSKLLNRKSAMDTFCILTSFLDVLIQYSHLYSCVPLVYTPITACAAQAPSSFEPSTACGLQHMPPFPHRHGIRLQDMPCPPAAPSAAPV